MSASSAGSDPRRWREVRRALNRGRFELARAARRLYPAVRQVGPAGLLAGPRWIPDAPVPLDRVTLGWVATAPPPAVHGGEPESAPVRPERPDGTRYGSYAAALAGLDPPRLLEDRPCYRLVGVDAPGGGRTGAVGLAFAPASYFDAVDVSEGVAHEFAAGVPGLPLRTLVGDPCDPSRRALVPAISVLTVRRPRAGDPAPATVYLHRRDPRGVVHAGGMYQVLPVGVFQPLTGDRWAEDLDLWHSMAREYSEELLGRPERYDDGFDHRTWPFGRALDEARAAGAVRVHLLGLGVDPLSLVTDLLVTAVFDADAFDHLFADRVRHNAEGTVAEAPLTADTVTRLTRHEPMQAAGATAIHLTWHHRHTLLAP